jgi:hypothetical protein
MVIETSIGYTDEYGFYIGYKPEFAFLNCCRREDLKKPILVKVGEKNETN